MFYFFYHFFKRKLFLDPQIYETIVFYRNTLLTPKMWRNISTPSLKIRISSPIPTVKKVTHLGITMNSRLSNAFPITKVLGRATVSSDTYGLPSNTTSQLFILVCYPIPLQLRFHFLIRHFTNPNGATSTSRARNPPAPFQYLQKRRPLQIYL